MTRFARAKGSKASNEKTPEDSTPWEVMKKQLLQSKKDNEETKKREEAEKQRIENYESFLKEHKVQKRKATWCDFPETQQAPANEGSPKKKKNKKIYDSSQNNNNDVNTSVDISQADDTGKKKKKNDKAPSDIQNNFVETPSNEDPKPLKKKKNKNKDINSNRGNKTEVNNSISEPTGDAETPSNEDPKPLKKKKNKNKKINPNEDPNTEMNNSISKPTGFANGSIGSDEKQKNRNKNTGTNSAAVNSMADNQEINHQNKIKGLKKKKETKFENGVPVRRKAINDRSFQLIINGKEVELTRCDGFPVMKKDTERLEELRTSMLKKGIPKSEVQRTLKLERRRAEKALARVKRDVCYNCRKGGHNLSDCPDLKSKIPGVDAAEGICFKCGSTEHRQFECKVQRDKEFRFATCFICKEPGHIARQCPDNPKGLYPNGGCCKICGDVTHLRKDCPTIMDKKEETSVKLQTLESAENIEDIGHTVKPSNIEETVKKPKKIKF